MMEHPDSALETGAGNAGSFPLTPAQDRLWFIEQMAPGTAIHHIAGAVRLVGAIDADAVAAALQGLVDRHEALRTSFVELRGQARQRMHDAAALTVARVDLREPSTGRADPDRLRTELEREAAQPFDLAQAPLIRARLLRTAGDEHVLALVIHHLVADGWSLGVLLRELGALYDAHRAGRAARLPELPIQYIDYAVWQHERAATGGLTEGIAAWTARLAGIPARLVVPGELAPSEVTVRGASCPIDLGAERSAAVRALARREKVTVFAVLLAGLSAALARLTGEHELVIGSPVSGRELPETQGVVGLFVNLVALRLGVDARRSFHQLVRAARDAIVDAQAHREVPFEHVVRALGRSQARGDAPLLQVVLAWQAGIATEVALGDARGRGEPIATGTAKFDLTVLLDDAGGAIAGAIEYRTDLYRPAVIVRLCACLIQVLDAALERPDAPLGRLDIVAGAERSRILAWSRGPVVDGAPDGVLDAFARHVAERPDAPALDHGGRPTSYVELDRVAEGLARRLIERGVARGQLVGVLMNRGPAAVIAMLAAWKAGAAYLPLDPGYPVERLRYLIGDAGVTVVCVEPGLHTDLPYLAGLATVIVDRDALASAAGHAPVAVLRPGPEDLAYVIYTSGSTGRPKGVEVAHRGLANLIAWHRDLVRPGDRASQVASLGFDASVWEIAGCLGAGGTLWFAPDAARTSPRDLCDWLVASAIDVCFAPTPLAERLLALDALDRGRLRLLLTGGDRLQVRPRPDARYTLVNNYGLTEVSVVSTSGRTEADGDAALSIGHPLPGHQVCLLDAELHLVPAGAIGEVYLGGEGVARGYRGRPALTAERFVPDPFGRPGARLYRTGDLASFGPGGELIFHGRIDDQVKIRGYRIELGEVAAVLEESASVARAVALIRRGPRAEPVLAAYLVPRPGASIVPAELREHARGRLPDAMVPSLYVWVDDVPLTPHGKVDRDALLRIEPPAAARPVHAPAASPAEELIREVWASLLGGDAVIDRDSSFFALGGHSLLAAQMIGRLREAFGRDIPLRWAFEAATPGALAARLSGPSSTPDRAPGPQRRARAARVVLSSAQHRLWFLDQFTGSGGAYNIAGALRLSGALDTAALTRSLAAITARHEVLRARFGEVGGTPYQETVADAAPALREVDLRDPSTGRADPSRLTAELERVSRERFDLSRAPLVRACLLRVGPDEHVLALVVHHIAADGWSIGVLLRELPALYEAFHAGRAAPLPELELQYADYAAWQRAQVASGALAASLTYWERRLAGAATLALPSAGPRGEASYCGGTVRLELPPELGRALRELARRQDVTLFMALVAAVQAVLARATGQDDVVVGTDVAGRSYPALESMIGLFVNQVVLRGDLGGDPGFRDVLARVRPVVLEAWAHQDVPFDALVEHLRPARELGRNPLFQVMVILQDALPSRLALGDVAAEPIDIEPEGSVFDLSLAFAPRDGGALGVSLRHAAGFGRERAERLLADLRAVLERVVRDPDARLSSLEVARFAQPAPAAAPRNRLADLRAMRPRAAVGAASQLVGFAPLAPALAMPVVVSPRAPDVDLAAWAAGQREAIGQQLARAGALLFRGFEVPDVASFRAIVAAISPDLLQYGERSSPRTALSQGIYTSTDHPPDQPILLHNEQSYTLRWPRRIWFCCLVAPTEGGRTPFADSRCVLARLRPSTVARFAERQVLYVRNYGAGLGLPWTTAFQTTDRAVVEDHCRRAAIRVEWRDHDRLRTSQLRPAIRVHPETGEATWFNHVVFFHATSLPAAVAAAVNDDDVPYHTMYGDGSPIEPDVLAELREAYAAETRSFPWRCGDILLLDNMLAAHGREPFAGPRQIVVAMTDPTTPDGPDTSSRNDP